MKFKKPTLEEELGEVHPKLIEMVEWFEQLSLAHFQKEPTITRVIEAIPGATDVHPNRRAVDIRDEYMGHNGLRRVYSDEEAKFLTSEMNRRFKGKDSKPSCIHHSFNGGPLHFHLQVTLGDLQ